MEPIGMVLGLFGGLMLGAGIKESSAGGIVLGSLVMAAGIGLSALSGYLKHKARKRVR